VEIRALPELPEGAKCTRCRTRATIRLPSHHAIVCPECFVGFFRAAVKKAMKKFGPSANQPLMVAVSGGKDSLALWDVLHELGYVTKGLHITLGIDDFSEASMEAVRRFAEQRGLPWAHYSLEETFGYSVPEIKKRTRRKICSLCGLLKRQMLNRLTIREGFQALAVGHNLDDEAGRLMGNIMRNRYQYLDKQSPFLPSTHPRLPARLKPLYRLAAAEIRQYCASKSIIPVEGKCPLSRGATSHIFKEALNFLENKMPGTKRDFLFTYLRRNKASFDALPFVSCKECGEPAFDGQCSVCRLKEQLMEDKKEADDKKISSQVLSEQ